MIRIFIGYDQRETAAAHVLHHSIMRHASMPVSITLLNRDNLRGLFTRERGELESTDFSISRFLVPYLCGYEGSAIFMDCDMVCRDDIAKLWAWRDERYAVRVVKHDYSPKTETKFLGEKQTVYACKNWSSVMLFDCAQCDALDLDYVLKAPGLDLHRFSWVHPERVGDLPRQWNHLVGYYPYDDEAALVHYTDGGPYFNGYEFCDYSSDWITEQKLTNFIIGQT